MPATRIRAIICYHLKDFYNLSYPVLFNYLGLEKNRGLLAASGVDLVDYKLFLSQADIKVVDSANRNNEDIDYVSYVRKAFSNLADIMRSSDAYDGSTLIGFQNVGSDPFFYREGKCPWDYYNVFKSKGCKFVMWMDDLHGFPRFPKIKDYEEGKDYSECSDYRLDLVDRILTPSRHYYELLSSQYLSKTTQYFYSLNEDWYPEIDVSDFSKRETKVLLSGALSAYPIRREIHSISRDKNAPLSELITVLASPGYNRTLKGFYDKVGLNYLKTIARYKGAFFGYGAKPCNFNLAKIIEILMCGTIGFFEFSPLLERDLGLVAFKHYVPLTDSNGKLIRDPAYYLKYMDSDTGRQIASRGANHVRSEFSSGKRARQLVTILNEMQ